MERISVRALASAIRLIREPVVVTYSYPRNHPLYGAGEECGVYVPLALWQAWVEDLAGRTGEVPLPPIDEGTRSPHDHGGAPVALQGTKGIAADYAESAE